MLQPADSVVAFTSDVVNASGSAISYPPIHLHHIHVMRGSGVHWYETHGDYDRSERDGYRRVLPEGFCDFTGQRAARLLLAQINDVRGSPQMGMSFDPSASHDKARLDVNNSRELSWFIRLKFELSPRPCRPLTKLIWWYPVTPFASNDRLSRYEVPSRAAVFWWTMRAPRRGVLLPPAWVHSHRARYAGLLLIRGAHSLSSLARIGPSGQGCKDLREARRKLVEAAARAPFARQLQSALVAEFISYHSS